jgi:glycosyltransferase involved in cell wall biosynthesis
MKQEIHIMHVLGDLGVGGAEMGVLRLIQNLRDGNLRHSIVIGGSDRTLLNATGSNVPCQSLGIEGRSYLAFMKMARLFRSQHADVVHVNNLALWPDAALGALLAGCRCVETFHGIENSQLNFSAAKRAIFKATARITARMTAVADEAAGLMAALTGINKRAIALIPNGVDTARFAPSESREKKRQLRISKQLPEQDLLIGCVAALRPVKNHRGLLQSFAEATQRSSFPVRLVLVGDGPLAGDLKAQTQELGIQNQVIFLGWRSDVPELLQCCDVFVLNSQTEGLSYALLEAMASGLPAIATAVGANPALIDPGTHGWLYPQGDIPGLAAILNEIILHPDVLQLMGQEARKRVDSEYSISKMAAQYALLYNDVLQ